jgi:NAD(P)H-hydrate epimerase
MALPIISVAQMREWEQATWATGRTESEVMDRVGLALARAAALQTRPDDLVLVLAGKGNNGEDARRAASHLQDRRTEILNVTDPSTDLARLEELLAKRPALVLDGLFGIGLNRPLSAEWVKFIEKVNTSAARVLAVDLPSGLNGDTGEHFGAAIQADVTLTVGAPKAGLTKAAAGVYAGRVEVAAEVGLTPCTAASEMLWTMPEDFHGFPPKRSAVSHKGTYGHLGIMAGSLGYHGAGVLAARGAQSAQPGLITLHTAQQAYVPIASQLQAVMVSEFRGGFKMPAGYTAHLVGPGLAAPEVRDLAAPVVRSLWRDSDVPLVIDASGFDILPLDPPARNTVRVLTPHPGEAARLLRCTAEQVQANRMAALRNISKRYGNCWVVLKGYQTLIGHATGEVYVNNTGNPYLAQGGSGDLLAGFLGGLLAQPLARENVATTIRYAVWQHGNAADQLQRTGKKWTVEDLAVALRADTPD